MVLCYLFCSRKSRVLRHVFRVQVVQVDGMALVTKSMTKLESNLPSGSLVLDDSTEKVRKNTPEHPIMGSGWFDNGGDAAKKHG